MVKVPKGTDQIQGSCLVIVIGVVNCLIILIIIGGIA